MDSFLSLARYAGEKPDAQAENRGASSVHPEGPMREGMKVNARPEQ
jgi:hypothetical protein